MADLPTTILLLPFHPLHINNMVGADVVGRKEVANIDKVVNRMVDKEVATIMQITGVLMENMEVQCKCREVVRILLGLTWLVNLLQRVGPHRMEFLGNTMAIHKESFMATWVVGPKADLP